MVTPVVTRSSLYIPTCHSESVCDTNCGQNQSPQNQFLRRSRQKRDLKIPCIGRDFILICNSGCSFRCPPAEALRLRPFFGVHLPESEGHNSRISCFEKRPIFCCVASRTVSSAGCLVSTSENRSSKSLYAARIVPSRYLRNGTISSFPSYHPFCEALSVS